MSLKNIISKIINDAEQRAKEIKKETSKSASLIIEEAERQAQALSWEIIKQTKQKVALENKRFEVNHAIEYKKETLKTKQKLIDKVFEKAKEALLDLKDEDYLSLIRTMLIFSVEEGNEIIVVSKKDKARIDEKAINLKIRVDENLKEGDFILETKNTRLDIGFDSVLTELREELLSDVAKILFKGK